MRRAGLVWLAAVLAAGCAGEPTRDAAEPMRGPDEIEPPQAIPWTDFVVPEAESDRVDREGPRLTLHLDDEGRVELLDEPAEGEDWRRFRFQGMLEGMPYFIVLRQGPGGGEYMLSPARARVLP